MKILLKTSFLLAACLSATPVATRAQMPPGPGAGLNAALTKLFGDFTAFSASVEARMLEGGQRETLRVPMQFALLDGKVRAEVNIGEMKGAQMPPEVLANLKQMGMDKMITVVRPDLKTTLMIYPALKAYAATPMPGQETAELADSYNVSKTVLGQETIEGHPCEKTRVTVTSAKGETRDALVWYAADMKGFPVQIQMAEQETTVVMVFRQVRQEKPDAALFDAPAGYTKHASMQALMQSAMMKMFGQ